jgi:hypothetical protein
VQKGSFADIGRLHETIRRRAPGGADARATEAAW